jgi:GNAT superfamily N-acetyltransferase
MSAAAAIEPVSLGTAAFEEYIGIFEVVFPEDASAAREFLSRYATYPSYRGLVARVEGTCVGMVFGVEAFRGNWWVDRVVEHLGQDHPALQDAFCLVDLGVLAPWRSQGIGQLLHDAVLAMQPHPRAVLSTQVANTGAQRFYLRNGWRIVHPGFVFAQRQEPYCVLAREALTP